MKKTDDKTMKQHKTLTDLKDVLLVLQEPLTVSFSINDGRGEAHPVSLTVNRAMPSLQEARRELLRSVQPPYVKERNGYDELNPHFLKQRDLAALQARSLTVYRCCPSVAAMKPGLLQAAEIHTFVSATLPEPIQEMIELTALAGGLDVDVERRASFISASASES